MCYTSDRMDKKDVYDHLAKIYLDASASKKPKVQIASSKIFQNLFVVSISLVVALSITLVYTLSKRKVFKTEVALVLLHEAARINFNFDPAKEETYELLLNKLNLSRFKELGFTVKRAEFEDNVSVKIEFINNFKEKSEVYLKDVSNKWQDYKIKLADFRNISDWSEMLGLSFSVQQWNTRGKKGLVYIDNIRVIQ